MFSPQKIGRMLLVALLVLGIGGAFVSTADARRQPTKSERKHIKTSIESTCIGSHGYCTVSKIWVSTVDSDYAWIGGTQDGDSMDDMTGVIKRTRHNGGNWKWALGTSGGPQSCKASEKHVPRAVLHDLRIVGSIKKAPYTERC